MINPHWLIDNSNSEQLPNGYINTLFAAFKKLIKSKNKDPDLMDAFAVGYFLGSNNVLRKKFIEEVEEPKTDMRTW